MHFTRYSAWVLAVVFLLLGIAYFIPNGLLGPSGKYLINVWMAVFYLLSALWLTLGRGVVHSYEYLLETIGVAYVIFAVLGFVFTPIEGNIFGLFEANTVAHWAHLFLGSASFFSAWIAHEILLHRKNKSGHSQHSNAIRL